MFAYVVNNSIEAIGQLPAAARRLDTNEWVLGLPDASVPQREACGWYEVAVVAPPATSPTQRAEVAVDLVDGRPTQVWTVRAETVEEATARTALGNRTTLTSQIDQNVDVLLTSVAALNEITARTNATINANPATAIKDLTREVKTVARQTIRIARLVSQRLESADSGS